MKEHRKHIIIAMVLVLALYLPAGCAQQEQGGAQTQLPGGTPQPSPQQQSRQMSSGGQQESGQQQGGQTIKPRQLISMEEAAQILGEPVKDCVEEEQQVLGMTICLYRPENAKSKGYVQVVVIQQSSMQQGQQQQGQGQDGQSQQGQQEKSQGQAQEQGVHQGQGQQDGEQQGQGQQSQQQMSPKSIFDTLRKAFGDPNTPPSSFVGEDRFTTAKGVNILTGDQNYIYISVGHEDPAKAEQQTKQAAELAVSNFRRLMGQ